MIIENQGAKLFNLGGLQLYDKLDRLLTVLSAQQIVTAARWNANKTGDVLFEYHRAVVPFC